MSLHQSVRSIMTHDVTAVELDSPVSAARHLLQDGPFHHLPVTRHGALVGILGLVDLYRVSLENWIDDDRTVDAWLDSTYTLSDVMTHNPDSVRMDQTIRDAALRLADGTYHALPVVDDDGQLAGIVTTTDLLRSIVAVG